ncbi:hypothetical protein [Streptomyces sp. NPDC057199]|uniref:hypothetical protein n=1 Tax=Streptomyces sp. NPDC057199 TaxID=3346047 RepID=UPI003635D201
MRWLRRAGDRKGFDEAMTSQKPPHAAADAVASLVAEHAAIRARTVDDHMFHGSEQHPAPGTFRLQLFTADGVRPVVLAVQTVEDGPSLINRAEAYAAAVWRCHRHDDTDPPLWIQRQLDDPNDERAPFQLVTFQVASAHRLTEPSWNRITAMQVEHLLGQPADGSRGDGYCPPPAEPEDIPLYKITRVVELPRPQPFRQPRCMPGPRSWRRLLFWHTHPARPASCCWYHQQDWAELSETAIRLVEDAYRDGVTGKDLAPYALGKAETTGLDAAGIDALYTLFSPGRAVCATTAFTNGQHRVQAMRDQGVSRTVTVSWDIADEESGSFDEPSGGSSASRP